MDRARRLADRATRLAERVDLRNRLARFQIDEATKANLRQLKVLHGDGLDAVVVKFYQYLHSFPETTALLSGYDEARLRRSQKAHWMRLLHCEFDQRYVQSCLTIGLVHYDVKVPPQTYIAAYSYFQAELLRAIRKSQTPLEFEASSISLGKVIMLDMSIALNAYILDAMALKL